ncbi:MAG: hypothetical protein M3O70_12340 [Actinomycetota bacterium]|nr:hypothetical protein [Actinomycetota bacterium]
MRRILLTFVLLVGLLAVAAPASASHGIGGHWAHKSNYFTVPIGDNVSDTRDGGEYQKAFVEAVKWWNNHPNVDLAIVPGKGCGQVLGTIQACVIDSDVWWTGAATNKTDSYGHAKSSYVRLEGSKMDGYSLRSKQKVWCHEIGHALRLGHRDVTTSCMKSGGSSQYPDQHDFDHIKTKHHIGKQDSKAAVFMASDSSPTVGPPAPTSSSSGSDDGGSGGDDGGSTCITVLCIG